MEDNCFVFMLLGPCLFIHLWVSGICLKRVSKIKLAKVYSVKLYSFKVI